MRGWLLAITPSARLTAAIATFLGAACLSAAAAGATHTQTHIYEAFTAAGRPVVHVSRTVRGSCFTGSSATVRADAWRCLTGNLLLDPCFSSAKAKGIVLCPTHAWSSSVLKLKLTSRLPRGDSGKPSSTGLPWAVETTSGAKCTIDTGASNVVDHRRANYFCTGRDNWLWGAPSRKSQPWTILSAPIRTSKLSRRVGISQAWF
jgi:hypothetical protein